MAVRGKVRGIRPICYTAANVCRKVLAGNGLASQGVEALKGGQNGAACCSDSYMASGKGFSKNGIGLFGRGFIRYGEIGRMRG